MRAWRSRWSQARASRLLKRQWDEALAARNEQREDAQRLLDAFVDTFLMHWAGMADEPQLTVTKVFDDSVSLFHVLLEECEHMTDWDLRESRCLHLCELLLQDPDCRTGAAQIPNMLQRVVALLDTIHVPEGKIMVLHSINCLAESRDNRIQIGQLQGFRKIMHPLILKDPALTREVLITLNHFLDTRTTAHAPAASEQQPADAEPVTPMPPIEEGTIERVWRVIADLSKRAPWLGNWTVEPETTEVDPSPGLLAPRASAADLTQPAASVAAEVHALSMRAPSPRTSGPPASHASGAPASVELPGDAAQRQSLATSDDPDGNEIREFMRVQGAIVGLVQAMEQAPDTELNSVLHTIRMLLLGNSMAQHEFQAKDGFLHVRHLLSQAGRVSADFSESQKRIDNIFGYLFFMIVDCSSSRQVTNLHAFKCVCDAVLYSDDANVVQAALDCLLDVLAANPLNVAAMFVLGALSCVTTVLVAPMLDVDGACAAAFQAARDATSVHASDPARHCIGQPWAAAHLMFKQDPAGWLRVALSATRLISYTAVLSGLYDSSVISGLFCAVSAFSGSPEWRTQAWPFCPVGAGALKSAATFPPLHQDALLHATIAVLEAINGCLDDFHSRQLHVCGSPPAGMYLPCAVHCLRMALHACQGMEAPQPAWPEIMQQCLLVTARLMRFADTEPAVYPDGPSGTSMPLWRQFQHVGAPAVLSDIVLLPAHGGPLVVRELALWLAREWCLLLVRLGLDAADADASECVSWFAHLLEQLVPSVQWLNACLGVDVSGDTSAEAQAFLELAAKSAVPIAVAVLGLQCVGSLLTFRSDASAEFFSWHAVTADSAAGHEPTAPGVGPRQASNDDLPLPALDVDDPFDAAEAVGSTAGQSAGGASRRPYPPSRVPSNRFSCLPIASVTPVASRGAMKEVMGRAGIINVLARIMQCSADCVLHCSQLAAVLQGKLDSSLGSEPDVHEEDGLSHSGSDSAAHSNESHNDVGEAALLAAQRERLLQVMACLELQIEWAFRIIGEVVTDCETNKSLIERSIGFVEFAVMCRECQVPLDSLLFDVVFELGFTGCMRGVVLDGPTLHFADGHLAYRHVDEGNWDDMAHAPDGSQVSLLSWKLLPAVAAVLLPRPARSELLSCRRVVEDTTVAGHGNGSVDSHSRARSASRATHSSVMSGGASARSLRSDSGSDEDTASASTEEAGNASPSLKRRSHRLPAAFPAAGGRSNLTSQPPPTFRRSANGWITTTAGPAVKPVAPAGVLAALKSAITADAEARSSRRSVFMSTFSFRSVEAAIMVILLLPRADAAVQTSTIATLRELLAANPTNCQILCDLQVPEALLRLLPRLPVVAHPLYLDLCADLLAYSCTEREAKLFFHLVRLSILQMPPSSDVATWHRHLLKVACNLLNRPSPEAFLHFGDRGVVRLAALEKFPPIRTGYTVACWLRIAEFLGPQTVLLSFGYGDKVAHELFFRGASPRGATRGADGGSQLPDSASAASLQSLTGVSVDSGAANRETRFLCVRSTASFPGAPADSFCFDQSVWAPGKWHLLVVTHHKDALQVLVDGVKVQSLNRPLGYPGTVSRDRPLQISIGQTACADDSVPAGPNFCGQIGRVLMVEGIINDVVVRQAFADGPVSDIGARFLEPDSRVVFDVRPDLVRDKRPGFPRRRSSWRFGWVDTPSRAARNSTSSGSSFLELTVPPSMQVDGNVATAAPLASLGFQRGGADDTLSQTDGAPATSGDAEDSDMDSRAGGAAGAGHRRGASASADDDLSAQASTTGMSTSTVSLTMTTSATGSAGGGSTITASTATGITSLPSQVGSPDAVSSSDAGKEEPPRAASTSSSSWWLWRTVPDGISEVTAISISGHISVHHTRCVRNHLHAVRGVELVVPLIADKHLHVQALGVLAMAIRRHAINTDDFRVLGGCSLVEQILTELRECWTLDTFQTFVDMLSEGDVAMIETHDADPELMSGLHASFPVFHLNEGLGVLMDLIGAAPSANGLQTQVLSSVAEIVASVNSNSVSFRKAGPGVSAMLDLLQATGRGRGSARRIKHPLLALLRTLIRREAAETVQANSSVDSPSISIQTVLDFSVAHMTDDTRAAADALSTIVQVLSNPGGGPLAAQLKTVSVLHIALQLLNSPDEALRIEAIKFLSLLLHIGGEKGRAGFDKLGGYVVMKSRLGAWPATFATCQALWGFLVDAFRLTDANAADDAAGTHDETDGAAGAGGATAGGSTAAKKPGAGAHATPRRRARKDRAAGAAAGGATTDDGDSRGNAAASSASETSDVILDADDSKFCNVQVLEVYLTCLAGVSQATAMLHAFSDLERALSPRRSVWWEFNCEAVLAERYWLRWFYNFEQTKSTATAHRRIEAYPDTTAPSSVSEFSSDAEPDGLIMAAGHSWHEPVHAVLTRLMLHDMSRSWQNTRSFLNVLKMVDAEQFMLHVLDDVLSGLEASPVLPEKRASNTLQNLAALLTNATTTIELPPRLCARAVGVINVLARANSPAVRAKLKDTGLLDARDSIVMVCVQGAGASLDSYAVALADMAPVFEGVAGSARFREASGALRLLSLFVVAGEERDTVLQVKLGDILACVAASNDECRKALLKVVEDKEVTARLVSALHLPGAEAGSNWWGWRRSVGSAAELEIEDAASEYADMGSFVAWFNDPAQASTRTAIWARLQRAMEPVEKATERNAERAQKTRSKQRQARLESLNKQAMLQQRQLAEMSESGAQICAAAVERDRKRVKLVSATRQQRVLDGRRAWQVVKGRALAQLTAMSGTGSSTAAAASTATAPSGSVGPVPQVPTPPTVVDAPDRVEARAAPTPTPPATGSAPRSRARGYSEGAESAQSLAAAAVLLPPLSPVSDDVDDLQVHVTSLAVAWEGICRAILDL